MEEKFKKGSCLYIISDRSSSNKKYMIETNEDSGFNPKNSLENKLFEKRVLYPNMRLDFLLYTKDCEIIKKCLDIKYRKNYMIGWVCNIDLEEIIESIETIFEFLELDLDIGE
jgi:hypothetical protein